MIKEKSIINLAFKNFKSIPKIDLEEGECYIFCYTREISISQDTFEYYLNFLPDLYKQKVLRYRLWNDRCNCLFGKLIIMMGASIFNYNLFEFQELLYSPYGKPYLLDSPFHFNISHSGKTVVCVFSKHNIGIDIEEINEIDYMDFENVFTPRELLLISEKGPDKFFEFWTKKESAIKAIGKGMSIPLLEIEVDRSHMIYDSNEWYIKSFKLSGKYCSITSNYNNIAQKQVQVNF